MEKCGYKQHREYSYDSLGNKCNAFSKKALHRKIAVFLGEIRRKTLFLNYLTI